MAERDAAETDDPLLHALKNHLSVILGYCDLLLVESDADSARRQDIAEIHAAARSALDLVPRIEARFASGADGHSR